MEEKRIHLAIDIGASSGRHIIGYWNGKEICTEEIYRFPNGVKEEKGHLVWDVDALLEEVTKGIELSASKYKVTSLAIDTWGVDYVLMNGESVIYPVYAYRDHRTEESVKSVHSIIPFSFLYSRTGIQEQSFNTIYQLFWDLKNGRLEEASDFLMIPEYLSYRLTGNKVKEYTNGTTTGLVDINTSQFDREIISSLSLPPHLFPVLHGPGTKVGEYKGIDVLLAPSHDTASAVYGLKSEDDEPYISSGTWSLLGLKVPSAIVGKESEEGNWSNEGGVGYIRYQKNIMGMWLINRLREELAPELSFTEIVEGAEKSSFNAIVDASSPNFLSPRSMKMAFDEALGVDDLSPFDYFRSALLSLAKSYGKAIRELERNTGRKFRKLYITGGGAGNGLLNRLTQEETGLEVVARFEEATSIGNLKMQMEVYDELQ